MRTKTLVRAEKWRTRYQEADPMDQEEVEAILQEAHAIIEALLVEHDRFFQSRMSSYRPPTPPPERKK